ncbi:hypothetical protein ACJ5H2_12670 [Nocardioides sp. R1-1]|uniref:hypothetical protein n=1 Tax=Nocardioides sp. R1-1 TaxID=3383502 RepID=UPI0038D1E8B7
MSSSPTRGSKADEWIERLRAASTRDEVLGAVWDLRDDAYDFPGEWQRVSAVRLLHFLADQLEQVADGTVTWERFGRLIGNAVADARSGTPSNWDG